jgi:hypothetical protein
MAGGEGEGSIYLSTPVSVSGGEEINLGKESNRRSK